ncbi:MULTISPECIES: ROK family transcriptional regulator [unclassified Curtobacterium]|uniref:ROK family transcriptional regulator n=1 Tax=unclassified Curtobacterium TaxID=257496 RepID=UPI0008DD9D1E|nr:MULTISPECIES: ROK family transcriptional regulator [unclassified Curtobacterium]OIH98544.1 hypothetical protein BIU92_12330 [Curtobacterium sp. MCBA15_003]OII12787.1 hypothetical protein BIU97_02240 [Curtobacterium sp. MCBA15_009]OII32269.1 hypothetical protein BIU94_02660 [Curtobacterium sp. MMLR14_006]
MVKGSNLLRLGDYNQAVVLDLLRRESGQSRAELQRRSGLASQTVSNITRRLIDAEMIREDEPALTVRGRPSIPLAVNGAGAFAIGVHVDPARLTILLLDVAGSVLRTQHLPTPQATNPHEVITLVAVATGRLIRDAGVDRSRVLGLGIAAPGPLDVDAGVVLDPPQLPLWRDVRLRADLHDATGLPVLLEKDVTAAATAELRDTAASDFLFVYLGSGVGASVVSGGRVFRGASNNIGEIGDILVDPSAEDLGWTGRRGGLAAACVPEALAIQAAHAGIVPLPDLDDYLAIDAACSALSSLADDGDDDALHLLERAARRLAVGIGVLTNFIDVPLVVLGGPTWGRLERSFAPVLETAVQQELIVSRPGFRVVGSGVGEQIAAQGAAELVMDHFLSPRATALVPD